MRKYFDLSAGLYSYDSLNHIDIQFGQPKRQNYDSGIFEQK